MAHLQLGHHTPGSCGNNNNIPSTFQRSRQQAQNSDGGFRVGSLNTLPWLTANKQQQEKSSLQIIAHGKSFCGWSNKQEAEIQKAHVSNVSYTKQKPEGCPNAPALPCWYAQNDGQCKIVSVGYQPVTDQTVQKLTAAAKTLF